MSKDGLDSKRSVVADADSIIDVQDRADESDNTFNNETRETINENEGMENAWCDFQSSGSTSTSLSTGLEENPRATPTNNDAPEKPPKTRTESHAEILDEKSSTNVNADWKESIHNFFYTQDDYRSNGTTNKSIIKSSKERSKKRAGKRKKHRKSYECVDGTSIPQKYDHVQSETAPQLDSEQNPDQIYTPSSLQTSNIQQDSEPANTNNYQNDLSLNISESAEISETSETDPHPHSDHDQSPNWMQDVGYTEEEGRLIEQFWKWYDDIIILSLFSILGVLCRLASAKYFSVFGNDSADDTALFTTLPLNCLSCGIMGLLCSGQELMQIVKRAWLKRVLTEEQIANSSGSLARDIGLEETREIQLAALERRIHASSSLVLFPAKKQDVDVMEHYYSFTNNTMPQTVQTSNQRSDSSQESVPTYNPNHTNSQDLSRDEETASQTQTNDRTNIEDNSTTNVTDNNNLTSKDLIAEAAENLKILARVNVADGWDVGTTPTAMSEDLLLGLRVGFCGALSTFASWNSDMVNLLRSGEIHMTIAGYIIGISLPMVFYRLGQHLALFIFIWRCRRETRRDEKRGYGIRIQTHDDDFYMDDYSFDNMDVRANQTRSTLGSTSSEESVGSANNSEGQNDKTSIPPVSPDIPNSCGGTNTKTEPSSRDMPSVRAIATAIAAMTLMLLFSSLLFFQGNKTVQRYCISLLFSPLGVLARWKMCQKWNPVMPNFPLGTFTCNILGCALSGSLGSLLAGNPDPEESIVLISMISGFAGSLSTLASFLVEVLNRIDPILFQLDGAQYALVTVVWAMFIGLISGQAKNWADDL